MVTEKNPSRTKKRASQPAEELSHPQGGREPLENALTSYVSRLVQVSAILQHAQQRAIRKYFDSVARAVRRAQSEFVGGRYRELLSALQSQEPERIRAAHAACTEAGRKLQSAVAEESRAGIGDYVSQLRSAWEQAQADSQAEYEVYLNKLKKALAAVSVETLDPMALASVGQTLITAAAYAAAASGTLASLPTSPGESRSGPAKEEHEQPE